MGQHILSREEQARREVGGTEISSTGAMTLVTLFLLVIFLVPLIQTVIDESSGHRFLISLPPPTGDRGIVPRIVERNTDILEGFNELESDLEENSFLRTWLLPYTQQGFISILKHGNEKVIPGRSGYLYYRPAVEYLIGPPFLDTFFLDKRLGEHELWQSPVQPDPVSAIASFHEELLKRGIELIVLPVPVKAAVAVTGLTRYEPADPLVNRSWSSFVERLEARGVQLLDVRQLLYDHEIASSASYLKTDTHWSPQTVTLVAKALSDYLLEKDPHLKGKTPYRMDREPLIGSGDLVSMLRLPESSETFKPLQLEIPRVAQKNGMIWKPDKESSLLLLGDSYTNIYSTPGLGFGYGGGLAEQLSYQLKRPVDVLARNDNGAYSSREMLSSELRKGRDRLATKRYVIWEFSERELVLGNWKKIPMELRTVEPSNFLYLESGDQPVSVTATIASISDSPRPETVPYRDNIVTLHLVDIEGDDSEPKDSQALVYTLGMENNRLTPIAALRGGDRISITLLPWDDVVTKYGSYRRTSLDEDLIELELPLWGVLENESAH